MKAKGIAAQGVSSSADGLGEDVGGVVVEEGQDIGASFPWGATELGEFFQGVGDDAYGKWLDTVHDPSFVVPWQ